MMDDFCPHEVSFLIKTFLRPSCCERLVRSIRRFYPDSPVLVADDSHRPLASAGNMTVYHLPFDSGISEGRNYLVKKVKTPYFVLCDDDIIVIGRTKIEKLHRALTRGFDIAGGRVRGHSRWYGIFDEHKNPRFHKKKGEYAGYPLYDFVQNFFMAKTDTFRKKKLEWPEHKKVREHQDFFLSILGKARITYIPEVKCGHKKRCGSDGRRDEDVKEDYKRYRYRWRY